MVRSARTVFDAYLMVDWSANSKPKCGKDSIWWCLVRWKGARLGVQCPENPPTRHLALSQIRAELLRLLESRRSVLIGFDFPYGYPAGFARALGLRGAPWRAAWDELLHLVHDDEKNHNNRFELAAGLNRRISDAPAPFWACPKSKESRWLKSRRTFEYSKLGIKRLRITEERAGPVQPTWKLFYAGSVGSQALLGIPYVHALRFDPELRVVSTVWPFETGFCLPQRTPGEGMIVHAEIWPSVIDSDGEHHDIRDARQVMALARHFSELDSKGDLEPLFGPPAGLSPTGLRTAEREEGWILGVQ